MPIGSNVDKVKDKEDFKLVVQPLVDALKANNTDGLKTAVLDLIKTIQQKDTDLNVDLSPIKDALQNIVINVSNSNRELLDRVSTLFTDIKIHVEQSPDRNVDKLIEELKNINKEPIIIREPEIEKEEFYEIKFIRKQLQSNGYPVITDASLKKVTRTKN